MFRTKYWESTTTPYRQNKKRRTYVVIVCFTSPKCGKSVTVMVIVLINSKKSREFTVMGYNRSFDFHFTWLKYRATKWTPIDTTIVITIFYEVVAYRATNTIQQHKKQKLFMESSVPSQVWSHQPAAVRKLVRTSRLVLHQLPPAATR